MTMAALEGVIPRHGAEPDLYESIREFVSRPGKGLRPALCLATCRAYGGRAEDALPSAAGIELLHNAFLVHDDIEDGSESRRGKDTMHRTLGVPRATNAGDVMNALAMRLFRRNQEQLGSGPALRIFDEVDHMLIESLEGQALELGWIRDNDCRIGTDDYLRLVLKKTAWYSFIHPMRIGAIVARPDDDALDRFHQFGFLLGAAFQIQDDVLNLVGDESRYGKEIGGDLWEGKRTLAVAHALSTGTAATRARLEQFLARPRESRFPRQLFDVQRMLEDGGSISWASGVASAFARAAQDALPAAFSGAHDGADLSFIRNLVRYLVERDV
jgi:geranylgeranyl pyrophosphate synthase